MPDIEAAPGGSSRPDKIPYWRLLTDQSPITSEILDFKYAGSGTEKDPYVVEWIPNDPRNPRLFSAKTKWLYTMMMTLATFGVSLTSSGYTGGVDKIMAEFHVSDEVTTIGVSLFVLGFALGPLIWAPLSELIGRQVVFFGTYCALVAFCSGSAGSQNIWTLLILRFFAGSFGSSPLTNAGGVIADIFDADDRGLATTLFAGAPFLGPTLGPVIGGFLGENAGWRWVQGFLGAFTGVIWISCSLLVPETYAPLLLRKRAAKLSQVTGKAYASNLELQAGKITVREAFTGALSRPWILLFAEPIVLLLSVYMAIVYGTLYMLFSAFPIVYQKQRGWSPGIGSLPFMGVMTGMMMAVAYNMWDNKRFVKIYKQHRGFAPPEARLPPTMIGGIMIPIGLFWFAWTCGLNVHWIVSIIAAAPFGFGMVLVFLGVMNYLIDAYTIYAASVLAANSIIRSAFACAFPLFTTYMYDGLGIHWASCIPAFLALACVPFPFIFYKYGPAVRRKCKYAAEADEFIRKLAEKALQAEGATEKQSGIEQPETPHVEEDTGPKDEEDVVSPASTSASSEIHSIYSVATIEPTDAAYQGNPYDIDRVNTRNSVITQHSRSRSRSAHSRRKGWFPL
ncbi:MFS transporter [Paecilomyces variotii No. 5]|uniref:MFS transporter n=1 Tax=Byssochlamys spectabilis (strain No. 5 / NBRC 109023) TaxID=1356009 RepID=V5FBW7_BYSSN|nr:MFS transporter [Paecilomyces variotii No. 5]